MNASLLSPHRCHLLSASAPRHSQRPPTFYHQIVSVLPHGPRHPVRHLHPRAVDKASGGFRLTEHARATGFGVARAASLGLVTTDLSCKLSLAATLLFVDSG